MKNMYISCKYIHESPFNRYRLNLPERLLIEEEKEGGWRVEIKESKERNKKIALFPTIMIKKKTMGAGIEEVTCDHHPQDLGFYKVRDH